MFSITSDIDFSRSSLLSPSETSKSNTGHFTVDIFRFFRKSFRFEVLNRSGPSFPELLLLSLIHVLMVHMFHLLLIRLLQMKTPKLNESYQSQP